MFCIFREKKKIIFVYECVCANVCMLKYVHEAYIAMYTFLHGAGKRTQIFILVQPHFPSHLLSLKTTF